MSTTRGVLRRLAVACVSGAVLVALAPVPTATAAPPLRETLTSVAVPECTGEAGGLSAVLSAFWADGRGDPSLTVSDPDGALAREDPEFSRVQWDGTVLTGQLVLLDARGAGGPAGTASFALTLLPDGAPTEERMPPREIVRSGTSNATLRDIVSTQPVRVAEAALTVVLDGRGSLPIAPVTCGPGTVTTTLRTTTRPDTSVIRDLPTASALCTGTDPAGRTLAVDVFDVDGLEVGVLLEEPDAVVAGSALLDWTGPPQPLRATVELLRAVPGSEPVPAGTAVVDLASRTTGRFLSTLVYQGGRDRTWTTLFRLDGTVTVDGSAPFTVAGCEGAALTAQDRTSSPSGPQPGGPAPAGDVPAGAVPLALDAPALNLQTRGTAADAEAPMDCWPEPLPQPEVPPGHTVWSTVTGTGGSVRIDPAGSTFNTVVAAYVEQGGRLVQVGCVDDLFGVPDPTTQPALVLPTEAGRTYLVQVGGYAGQLGRLRLAATAV